jgi:hypothetical protein
MDENDSKKSNLLVSNLKRGIQIYRTNPSIPDADNIKTKKIVRLGNEKKGFIIDGAGEVLGQGTASFYEFEEIDNTRFVKLFLAGMKQASGLSKAGLSVFELVYQQIQEKPNIDKIELSHFIASDIGINERSYRRGLRELLEREFLFRSLIDGVFFVNIRYMFNGDRLAFVKGYKCKGESQINKLEAPKATLEDLPSMD